MRLFSRLVFTACVVVGLLALFPAWVLAGAPEYPRLILKSFLPLSEQKVIVYGKVLLLDAGDAKEEPTREHLEMFFHHRARQMPLTITIGAASVEVKTDDIGDFTATFLATAVAEIRGKTSVTFTSSAYPAFKETAVYDLPLRPKYLVVSDIDDSVLVSNGDKFFKKITTSLLKPIHRREAVPGTPAIYRDLITGTQGQESLLVFLSGSPVYWAPRLETFFADKAFPPHSLILQNIGPKERYLDHWLGHVPEESSLASGTTEYKLMHLAQLLKWFPDLPVILFGDTLAKDPEIYQQIATTFPGRVRLVVIRNISNQPAGHARYTELQKVAKLIVWSDPSALRQALVAENLIADTPPMPPAASQTPAVHPGY